MAPQCAADQALHPLTSAHLSHEPWPLADTTSLNGWILGVAAASLISWTNLFSLLHFNSGSTPVTFLFFRYLFILIALLIIMRCTAQSLVVQRPYRRDLAIVGFLSAAGAGCLSYAIDLIPISLVSSILERSWPSKVMTAGLICAFAGLLLAVGPDSQAANPIGLLFAFSAAVGIAASFVWTERTLGQLSDGTRLLGLMGTGLILAAFLAIVTGDLVWPMPEPHGWSTLLAATATFGAAFSAMFMALARIGASATAMLMNLEPPLTALLAVTVLGDVLSTIQIAGILIVISTIILVQWHTRRQQSRSLPLD